MTRGHFGGEVMQMGWRPCNAPRRTFYPATGAEAEALSI